MKCAVVYTSSTGFTKQYAEWIGEALSCPCFCAAEAPQKLCPDLDAVIYGGWVFGNNIMGLEQMRQLVKGKLVVFAVGASNPKEAVLQTLREQNHLEQQPLFYFQGGFRLDQLGFAKRMLLKMVKKMAEKKKDPTPQDQDMVKILGTSFDASDRAAIAPLVETLQ